MGLDLEENQPSLNQEEKKKLNIYVDNVERIEKKNKETISNISKLVNKVVKNCQILSDNIFELGEEFKILAESFKTIESISGSSLQTNFVKQGDLYETLKNTCLDFSKAIKRTGSNFERHFPPFLKIHN